MATKQQDTSFHPELMEREFKLTIKELVEIMRFAMYVKLIHGEGVVSRCAGGIVRIFTRVFSSLDLWMLGEWVKADAKEEITDGVKDEILQKLNEWWNDNNHEPSPR